MKKKSKMRQRLQMARLSATMGRIQVCKAERASRPETIKQRNSSSMRLVEIPKLTEPTINIMCAEYNQYITVYALIRNRINILRKCFLFGAVRECGAILVD